MSDTKLMQAIKDRWGEAINTVCAYSSIPLELIAALIANESGGNPLASRFELGVYNRLRWLQSGNAVKPYAGLSTLDVRGADDVSLRELATSWGLTQIMGYHTLRDNHQPTALLDPSYALSLTVRLLTEFAERFGLDVAKDFDELFHCWNTGQPDGKCWDSAYPTNGVMRAGIYRGLK